MSDEDGFLKGRSATTPRTKPPGWLYADWLAERDRPARRVRATVG